jgi:hypothetical protein
MITSSKRYNMHTRYNLLVDFYWEVMKENWRWLSNKFRYNFVISTTNLIHTSLLHFIVVQCVDRFGAVLAHPQEALHKRRIGVCFVRL